MVFVVTGLLFYPLQIVCSGIYPSYSTKQFYQRKEKVIPMKKFSSKVRSLLLGGAIAIITLLSVLFAYVSCSHDKTDTGKSSSVTEVTTCTTTTTTSTTSNLTTSSTTTSTTTTTTTAEIVLTTVPIATSQTIAVAIETQPVYVSPATEAYVEPVQSNVSLPITERERVLLCNVVANEYGSDWVSVYDKACVVATVMNRVNNSQFPNDIESVLTQPYQFSGYWASDSYYSTVTDSCVEAVNYYFEHPEEFGSYLYFEGDGYRNYFH